MHIRRDDTAHQNSGISGEFDPHFIAGFMQGPLPMRTGNWPASDSRNRISQSTGIVASSRWVHPPPP